VYSVISSSLKVFHRKTWIVLWKNDVHWDEDFKKMRFVPVAFPRDSMFALECSYAHVRRSHSAWNLHCVRMHCSVGDRACVCVCVCVCVCISKMKLFPGGAASPVKDDHNTQESTEHTDTLSSYNYTTYYNTTAAPHTHTCYSDHCSFNS